ELLLRFLVAGIAVGMVRQCQLPVGGFYRLGVGVPRHLEGLVVINSHANASITTALLPGPGPGRPTAPLALYLSALQGLKSLRSFAWVKFAALQQAEDLVALFCRIGLGLVIEGEQQLLEPQPDGRVTESKNAFDLFEVASHLHEYPQELEVLLRKHRELVGSEPSLDGHPAALALQACYQQRAAGDRALGWHW